jgi:hypothetical protein
MQKIILAILVLLSNVAYATTPVDDSVAGPYNCNDTIGPYDFPYRFLASTHLEVVTTTAGINTTLVLTTDYTVTNTGTVAGGSVTLTVGSKCPTGSTLTIKRTVPFTQTVSFRTQGTYSPATLENSLDLSAMRDQQLDRKDGEIEATHTADKAAEDSRYTAQLSRDSGQDVALEQARTDFTAGGGGFGDATNIIATGSVTARSLADRFKDVRNVKDWGASGSNTTTTGTINNGSTTLTVASAADFKAGQGIAVTGAGAAGAKLITTISTIVGTTLTLANAASASVVAAVTAHDDTTAIRAAVTALEAPPAPGDRYQLYFPPGIYNVSSTITLTVGKAFRIFGAGPDATKIIGNIDGFIFDHHSAGSPSAYTEFSQMHIVNQNSTLATAGVIWLEDTYIFLLDHLHIENYGGWGIRLKENTFTGQVRDSRVSCVGYDGIGVATNGHASFHDLDVAGCGEGLRAWNANVAVVGGRFEVNRIAFRIGVDDAGGSYTLSNSFFAGVSSEANDIVYQIEAASNVAFVAVGQGTTNSGTPDGDGVGDYGFKITGGSPTFIASGIGGSYHNAAIFVGSGASPTFIRTTAVNNYASGVDWDVSAPLANLNMTGSSDPDLSGLNAPAPSFFGKGLATNGITALDMMSGYTPAKNVRGKGVVVASAATYVDITFPVNRGSGDGAMSTTVASDGAGTLAEGTYYYCATLVTPVGESSCAPEKIVTVTAPNDTVTLSFYGISGTDPWKRRIYRGTASGVYDGFYDLPVRSSTAYVDTNAAFAGKKSPPTATGANASGAEVDANYAVITTPAWSTNSWVTNKTTTGFRINFSIAPGGDSSVDWFLVR